MIKYVLKLKPSSLEKLDIRPTKYELKIMIYVTKMSTTFKTATLQPEGQNVATSSLLIVCVRCLRQKWINCLQNDSQTLYLY